MTQESRFRDSFPPDAAQEAVEPARTILIGTHATCSSFADLYDQGAVRDEDEKQDLLRAMLVFASAGLDSCVKQLVSDALPQVIDINEGAQDQFRRFVERRLAREDSRSLLASALSMPSPRATLIDALVEELRSGSLQSGEELSRTAAYFDIPTTEVIPDWDGTRVAFRTRNQISHELDTDPDGGGSRRVRTLADMRASTEILLSTAQRFLHGVDRRL